MISDDSSCQHPLMSLINWVFEILDDFSKFLKSVTTVLHRDWCWIQGCMDLTLTSRCQLVNPHLVVAVYPAFMLHQYYMLTSTHNGMTIMHKVYWYAQYGIHLPLLAHMWCTIYSVQHKDEYKSWACIVRIVPQITFKYDVRPYLGDWRLDIASGVREMVRRRKRCLMSW
jgi:hypothetical protein